MWLRPVCDLRRSSVVTSCVVTAISRRAFFVLTNISLKRFHKDVDAAPSYLDKFCGICVRRVREVFDDCVLNKISDVEFCHSTRYYRHVE